MKWLYLLLVAFLRPLSALKLNEDVRWLQFVQQYQSQLNMNTSISSLPMCTTWISNNFQTTRSLNRTLSNLEKWGQHCISKIDCIRGQLSFQNQALSIVEQLSAGVRRLVLELHYVPNFKKKLRLCASLQGECKAMKKTLKVRSSKKRRKQQYNWCKSFMLNSQGVHTGCHKGSPELKVTIREIIKWINKNQDQFIVIDLIDVVSEETGCQMFEELQDALELFGSRLLQPLLQNAATENLPSLSQLRRLGKNVMIRSSCTFGGSHIFLADKSDYKPIDEFSDSRRCRSASPFALHYHDRIHVDVTLSKQQKLRSYRTEQVPTKALLQRAARCNSQIALQATSYKALFGCSWTWQPHHDNIDCTACTSFFLHPETMAYGWVNTNCSRMFHLPCRFPNGTYSLTPHNHYLPNSGHGQDICRGGSSFAIPLTPRDAYSLAVKMWKYGLSYVWLPRQDQLTCTDTVSSISCGVPEPLENGLVLGDDFSFDGVVRYQCHVGYKRIGQDSRMCLANGTWTPATPPICQRVDCGMPDRPTSCKSYGSNTFYGSKFGYTCNWGYVFEGQASTAYIVSTCQEDGAWSTIVPNCIRRQCQVSEWSVWSDCSASCDEGFQTRERQITSSHGNEINGNCPALEERRVCNARTCDTCTTRSFTTPIEADTCSSAEPVTNRFCTSTPGSCKTVGMCCKATRTSVRRITLFCEDSRARNYKLHVIEECGCVACGSG